LAVTLFLAGQKLAAEVDICYGSNTTIATSLPGDTAIVGYSSISSTGNPENPSSPTVTVAAGAQFFGLRAYNSSIVNITGGAITGGGVTSPYEVWNNLGLTANGYSTVNIHGGTVATASPQSHGTINVYQGASVSTLLLNSPYGGNVNVYGGVIGNGIVQGAEITETNTLTIYGGTITGELILIGGATVSLWGNPVERIYLGTVLGRPTYGYYPAHIVTKTLVNSNATLPFNGSTYPGFSEYQLSGQLSDGSSVNGVKVYVQNDGISGINLLGN
jgi:hypothetical protein